MTIPVNRFGWVVEPPQSIRDYSSDRSLFIGQIYLAIVRLLGLGFPEEGNEGLDVDTSLDKFSLDVDEVASSESLVKNQLVLLYMNFLGPVIVDQHIRPVLDRKGNPVKRANGIVKMELDFDPDSLTWEMVFATFPEIKRKKNELMRKYSQPPIGEPERDHFHFVNRNREIEYVIYDEVDFEDKVLDKDTEVLAERVKAAKKRITGGDEVKTPRKRKATGDGEASAKRRKSLRNLKIAEEVEAAEDEPF
jgi:hypothetical protein